MSGIVGLWNRTGEPVDAGLLDRLCAPLAHRAIDGEDRHRSSAFAVAHQHSWVTPEEQGERQPITGRQGNVVAFDGRLDNRAELLEKLKLPREASDGSCVLAAYELWGDRFVEQLNGDFALCLYDPARPAVLLARDVIGLRPMYYYRDDHR